MCTKKAMVVVDFMAFVKEKNGTEEMAWKVLAQINLNQNNNFRLTQIFFGELVKIK